MSYFEKTKLTDSTGNLINPASVELQASIANLSDTLLYFVTAVLNKMPTLTPNSYANVTPNGGTVGTVSAVSTVGAINSLVGGNTALIPFNLAQASQSIYANILVSTP